MLHFLSRQHCMHELIMIMLHMNSCAGSLLLLNDQQKPN